MPTIVDRLYREYCRARLAEMRKQLLISAEKHEVLKAIRGTNVAIGANPTVGGETCVYRKLRFGCSGDEVRQGSDLK